MLQMNFLCDWQETQVGSMKGGWRCSMTGDGGRSVTKTSGWKLPMWSVDNLVFPLQQGFGKTPSTGLDRGHSPFRSQKQDVRDRKLVCRIAIIKN